MLRMTGNIRWAVPCFFLLGLSFTMSVVFASGQCRTEVNIQGMALKGFVFKTISVSAPYKCDVRCEREITCQSYNYVIKEKICELNNRTKEARPENCLPDPARFYIRRLNGRVPLGSIPELPAQSCQEIKASEGKETKSNKYWLDPTGTGTALLVSCDKRLKAWFNFTTLNATGRHGPDSNAVYRDTALKDVQIKNGKQEWTVPFTLRFRVEACGASGEKGIPGPVIPVGGRGAKINGTVTLEKGVKLVILVGQKGLSPDGYPGSGGGGTFVVYSPDMRPLLVAGGGGGGGVQDGFPGNDRVNGSGNGAGSNGGGGFVCGDAGLLIFPNSGSGAGINGSGGCFNSAVSGKICTRKGCNKGGKSFISGGEGGEGGEQADCDGGFGGGGACENSSGGGGGYSGGGLDPDVSGGGGGGGGSFVEDSTWSIIKGGCDDGDGYVSFVSED